MSEKPIAGCAWAIVAAIAVFFLLLLPTGLGEPIFMLLVGWIAFLARVLPEVSWSVAAIVQAIFALGLLTAVAHGLAGWLYRGTATGEHAEPRRWRPRWTVAGVLVVLLMFAAGISMLGMVHQLYWIVESDEPLMTTVGERPMGSSNNLRQMVLGAQNHDEEHGELPPNGRFDGYGEGLPGWAARLTPYLEYDLPIDWDEPWTAPANKEPLATPIGAFANPDLRDAPRADEAGYALIHYAGNSHVLRPGGPARLEDIADGTSETLLIGEVNGAFLPWGHPVNTRDPAMGINRSPAGFGGPSGAHVVHFAMADGSVRTISEDIDPEVLRALARPDDGPRK